MGVVVNQDPGAWNWTAGDNDLMKRLMLMMTQKAFDEQQGSLPVGAATSSADVGQVAVNGGQALTPMSSATGSPALQQLIKMLMG